MHHTVAKCGHMTFGQCWMVNNEICRHMVKPNISECGHYDILIPCFEQGNLSSGEISLKYCEDPCGSDSRPTSLKEERGCGHSCFPHGSCQKCFGGVYHVRCEMPCGRQLVCGHL